MSLVQIPSVYDVGVGVGLRDGRQHVEALGFTTDNCHCVEFIHGAGSSKTLQFSSDSLSFTIDRDTLGPTAVSGSGTNRISPVVKCSLHVGGLQESNWGLYRWTKSRSGVLDRQSFQPFS
jgi:hypothetical protein